jgi:hypothetical protein
MYHPQQYEGTQHFACTVFVHKIIKIMGDYFCKNRGPIGFYNPDGVCLLLITESLI